ncbi:MAG: class I mannose-6-phosphate isomerase [Caldilineaceae bacterium]|nr:class I mannose-6-phosphate isomerase [Caldilineaceae bacterium]
MPTPALYPLTFSPVFKDYPWGGRNLATLLGRTIPDGIVAESWEIADHPNGASAIANGALQGATLQEALAKWGTDLVGSRNADDLAQGRFPLLVKLLDANRWLSVQVHPDDAYARQHEGESGKTEMWVVLHAEPGAELIYGFAPGVSRELFAEAIEAGETERWLHRMPVQKDDVIFVPTGTIHALGPGILVAEIQQNSDTTYRIYDWGRPRPLHIQQALDVLDFGLVEPEVKPPVVVPDSQVPTEVIGESRYFRTERLRMSAGNGWAGQTDGRMFEIWGVLAGEATLNWAGEPLTLAAVSWMLIPAGLGEFRVTAASDSVLLRVVTP